ncbi:hypothetical protein VNO77_03645 [Canavalia gladiata]|uniref:Uncharacterized protein n=1 Tax=Canavalia gladiata TaxID=3824 RepID=A0AAN9MV37_CANGL
MTIMQKRGAHPSLGMISFQDLGPASRDASLKVESNDTRMKAHILEFFVLDLEPIESPRRDNAESKRSDQELILLLLKGTKIRMRGFAISASISDSSNLDQELLPPDSGEREKDSGVQNP